MYDQYLELELVLLPDDCCVLLPDVCEVLEEWEL